MDSFLCFLKELPDAVGAVVRLFKLCMKPRVGKVAFAATVLVLMIGLARQWPAELGQSWSADGETYETAIAEQRRMVLADGSILELNTNSKATILYGLSERRIELVRGEARFTVAKDPARPFSVTTPQAVIQDIGTVFNVYIDKNDRTVTTVFDGMVRIQAKEWQTLLDVLWEKLTRESTYRWHEMMDLRPGEQASVTADGRILRVQDPPLEKVQAWPKSELIFKEDPLEVLVDEFNRYYVSQIYIVDHELARCPFTLTMKAQNRADFIGYLEKFSGVIVRTRSDGNVYLYRGKSRTNIHDACQFVQQN